LQNNIFLKRIATYEKLCILQMGEHNSISFLLTRELCRRSRDKKRRDSEQNNGRPEGDWLC
jgi:hypothetical protein